MEEFQGASKEGAIRDEEGEGKTTQPDKRDVKVTT